MWRSCRVAGIRARPVAGIIETHFDLLTAVSGVVWMKHPVVEFTEGGLGDAVNGTCLALAFSAG